MLTLLVSLIFQADPSRWVEALGSDRIEDREAAVKKLKELGEPAVPALQKAAASGDKELSTRAKLVLRLIALRALLTDPFRKACPNAEERIDRGEAAALLVETAGFDGGALRNPQLSPRDLEEPARLALKSARDAEETVQVLRAIDRWRLKSLAPQVHEILKGESEPAVQLQASSFLCRWAEPSMFPLLLRKAWPSGFLGPQELNRLALRARWASLYAVGRLRGSPDAVVAIRALRPLLASQNSGQTEGAIRMLAALGDEGLAADLLQWSAEGRPADVRAAAVELLGDPKALLPLLKDPWPNLKMAATRTLFRLGKPEGLDGLLDLLAGGEGYVYDMTLESLAGADPSRVLPVLIGRLETQENAGLLEAIGATGSKEHAALLVKSLSSKDPKLRAGAARGLGYLQDPAQSTEIIPLLGDSDGGVRQRAIDALVRLGARDALPRLRSLPKDASVISALGALEDRESLAVVRAALGDPSPALRMTAARAITRIAGPEAGPSLMTLMSDSNLYVRSAAAEQLKGIDAARAVPPLKRMLQQDDPYLCWAVAGSLCSLGVREAAPLMIEQVRDAFWQDWLLELNALRAPEGWKKLGAASSKRDLSGTGREILEHLAREAGLAIEISEPILPDSRRWLASRQRRRILQFAPPSPSPSVRDMLFSVLAYGPFDAVLDEGRLRILERLEAQRFWEAWEEETRPR